MRAMKGNALDRKRADGLKRSLQRTRSGLGSA